MRLLHEFFPGFEAHRDGHKLKHVGGQIADRACYGSAPKAQIYLFDYLPTVPLFLSDSRGRDQIC